MDTVVCLTLDKWETVSGQFGGYLTTFLSILYKEMHNSDEILALKMDETYRGGGWHLRRLIEHRMLQRGRELKS